MKPANRANRVPSSASFSKVALVCRHARQALALLPCFWWLNVASAAEVFVYDNTQTDSGVFYPNGGAANQGGDTITTLVADDITPLAGYGGQSVSNIYYSVVNNNGFAVSARVRVRFWYADGPGGTPGTFITGYTLGPITLPAGAFYSYFSPSGGMTVPTNTFWFGMTFDDNTNTTGITAGQLNNLGPEVFGPPATGSSADLAFQSTSAGSFFGTNNPDGSTFTFGGSPAADFYFGMSVQSGNGPPVANPQSVAVLKNHTAAVTLTGSDADGDLLTYAIVNSPTNGTLSGTPPSLSYTPRSNFVGSDAFTFKVNDGQTDSVPALVSVAVLNSAGLVIRPIYDTSITSYPNAATVTNTINAAILAYETHFSDPVTVTILFENIGSGLGQSSTYFQNSSYSSFFNALSAHAVTTNDAIALAHLTGGATDPVTGGTTIALTTANLRALGLSGTPPTNFDGTIWINLASCNLDRSSIDPSKYDLMAVASHEIDEVLGTSSGLGQGNIEPPDLFRYSSTPGVRNYTTSGDDAYFSLDGRKLLVQYNQDPSGDYGDWWSTGSHTPRVQDAFGTPGATPNLGAEYIVLDAVGWTLVDAILPPRFTSITRSNSTVRLSWSAVSGDSYQLQYATNLNPVAWFNLGGTLTASNTMASYTDPIGSGRAKFYRVSLLSGAGAGAAAHPLLVAPLPAPTLETHYFGAHQ